MKATNPNDLDTTRCVGCGAPAWFDATDSGWTHDDPSLNIHPVHPEEAETR